jgi:RNA polymerase sigma factor (sigma-70 family)
LGMPSLVAAEKRMKRAGTATYDPTVPQAEARPTPAQEWERAIGRYARLVYSIPRRYGLSAQDAEDVFQSTMLTAMRREPAPPPEDRIVRFLASIASWETRGLLRRRRPTLREPWVVAELGDKGELPAPVLEQAEDLQALSDALAALRPRERRLLQSLYLEKEPLSYQETARRLGVAVGSVGELKRRAIDKLRAELARRGFPGR